jgi:predicted Zn-dependent peptidase
MTQMGGLAYFVNFLKASGLFDHLVEACPLAYESNNAPEKRDVLGTMLLSVLSGQTRYAHTFVSDLIRKARKSLILIDNYVDDTVLTLLAKRKKTVSVTIYTKKLSKQLALDLQKHNQQYPPITVETFADAHDRFLIIDERDIYHIGASLKDLGKKWFAFSKFETDALEMLQKLRGQQ